VQPETGPTGHVRLNEGGLGCNEAPNWDNNSDLYWLT
jgi:hypothetical protein